ncbi:MAG: response regulator [Lachnospiraceae bacterium]|jgi:two-component system response regulator YesN|nr:response regulator [Lachnospiraceae bacterium]MCI9680188.1 response regulator [Lachnospiraceae bacterium]
MYKIMLADDEGIVIDSLTYIIRQNFDGECQVESAKTGRSVIELAEGYRPDIAFMDIQMPGINGIEAMKEIRKNNPNLIFIVMSAYDKFDYAQEAINLGVLEYLHKPVNQKKIVEVIRKAMSMVDSRREKRSRDLETKEKLEIVVPMLEQGFIMAGLLQAQDRPGLENYKSLLGISESHMFTLVLEFGDEKKEQGVTNPVGAGVRLQGSYQQIRSMIKEYYTCYVGPLMNNRLVCCVPTDMEQGDYESRARDVERCRRMMERISDACGLTCRVGVGSILPVDKLEKSYEDASKALGNSDGSVAHCRDLPIFCEYEEDYPLGLEEQLFDCVRAGKGKETRNAAEAFFDWMAETQTDYMPNIRLKVLEFVLFMEYVAYKSGGMMYRFRDRSEYLDVVRTGSLEEMRRWFLKKAEEAAANVSDKKKEYSHEVIEKARVYISRNYKKDLSLESMSREMDMSPYYFSKLFKEVTGTNFVEYVTSIRIRRAKELLREGKSSVKQICQEIGYGDPNYFSRIFKKWTGQTPTEFKEGNEE